jgi:tetratricopeptide (TPR) repeat protein
MDLLGGQDHLAAGPARDRFFNDAMTFARKLSAMKKPDAMLIDRFFDRASVSAGSPGQRVDYYLTRGAYDETLAHDDTADAGAVSAVKLYQQILSNPKLRDVQRLDDKGHNTDAATIAESGIDRMIAVDAAAYGSLDQQAAAALAKATVAKADGAAFQDIAKTYPNSSTAPKALLAAADAYESAGQSKEAIRVLRQMYFERKNDQLAPQLLEAMARNYLKRTDHSTSDRLSAAAASLSRAVAIAPDSMLQRPLPLPDGQTLQNQTLAQALTIVRQERGQESAKLLPDFHMPIPVNQVGVAWPTPFAAAGPADVIPDTRALLVPAPEFARPDRVVTQDTHSQLCIYPAMQPDPLAKIEVSGHELSGSAWAGNTLLAWGSTAIFAVKDGATQSAWALNMNDLPAVQVSPDDSGAAEDDDRESHLNSLPQNGAFQPQMAQNVIIRRNGLAIRVITAAPGGQFGNETLLQVRPVGDRIVCMTSAGRIVALDSGTGKLAWQARPGLGVGSSFVANEDFTVVRSVENDGIRLSCFDTFTGKLLGEKSFPNNNAPQPTNMALAADGTLVYTIGDRIALKDLFKPWGDQPDKQSPPQPGQAASSPNPQIAPPDDQLVISEGRILSLWNDNPNNQMPENGSVVVRIFSLDTAQPIALHYSTAQGAGQLPVQLDAGHTANDVSLRAVGSRLYIVGGSLGISSYDLDHPGRSWMPLPDTKPANETVSNAFIGKNHILLLTQPLDAQQAMNQQIIVPQGIRFARGGRIILNPNRLMPVNGPQNPNQPAMSIYAFARYASSSGADNESGRCDYTPLVQPSCAINDAAGVESAQGVDGGICYLTGDNKLHLLKGTAQ